MHRSGRMKRATRKLKYTDGRVELVFKPGLIFDYEKEIKQVDEPSLFEYAFNVIYGLPKLINPHFPEKNVNIWASWRVVTGKKVRR